MYPCDSALRTMCGIETGRLRVCVNKEKGYGEYSEDGRSLSAVSVRDQACIDMAKVQPLIKLHLML